MKLNISTELDLLFEVPSLLMASMDFEKSKSVLIKELDKIGLNGEVYYNKNLKILEKYVKSFKKNMVINDTDKFLLEEKDLHANMVFIYVLLNNRKIYENIDLYTNNDLRLSFLQTYNDMFETTFPSSSIESLENILLFLNQLNFNETTKWRFVLILENPKKYYSTFIDLINKNIDAYNDAIKSISKHLPKLLNNYVSYIENDRHSLLNSSIGKLNEEFTVIPSLIAIGFIVTHTSTIYAGLLLEPLYNAQVNSMGSRGDLVLKLKSLADKSKLEILLLLKTGSKYSLEIADALKLTPATVSYHMSSLLECAMVSVSKKDGRSYYELSAKSIEDFLNELKKTLLS